MALARQGVPTKTINRTISHNCKLVRYAVRGLMGNGFST